MKLVHISRDIRWEMFNRTPMDVVFTDDGRWGATPFYPEYVTEENTKLYPLPQGWGEAFNFHNFAYYEKAFVATTQGGDQ